jgi:hypothetical protein
VVFDEEAESEMAFEVGSRVRGYWVKASMLRAIFPSGSSFSGFKVCWVLSWAGFGVAEVEKCWV